jgi:hypothetical protein
MTLSFNARRDTRTNSRIGIAALLAAMTVLASTQSSFAQSDAKPADDQPTIILNKPADPAVEINADVLVEPGQICLKPLNIAGPSDVVIAAPDEEIIIEGKPKLGGGPDSPDAPPAIRRKLKIEKGERKEGDIEQRLARMERMIERLVERESVGAFAFNDKEFSRVQKDLNRATREAEIAVRRLDKGHPEFGKNFMFEHKIAVAGSAKAQRKALEAQRKALQKQMQAIEKRLESLEDEGDDDDENGSEKLQEEESQSSKESSTSSDKQ